MADHKLEIAMALYVLGAVLCFGPAMVQSERARDEHLQRCKAERANDKEALKWCPAFGPSPSDAFPKAVAWPLWISYTVASWASKEGSK